MVPANYMLVFSKNFLSSVSFVPVNLTTSGISFTEASPSQRHLLKFALQDMVEQSLRNDIAARDIPEDMLTRMP
jgi:hypothetical protein